MENIKHQQHQYNTRKGRSPHIGLRMFHHACFTCSDFLHGIKGIFHHYLPLQSEYTLDFAKPTRKQRFAIGVRSLPIMMVFAIMMTGIAIHCYKLLVIRHPELEKKAQAHCKSVQSMQGARGCIYTNDYKLLAGNYFQKDIFIEPKKIPEKYRSQAIEYIAAATHKPKDEIEQMFFNIIDKDVAITLSSDADSRTAKRIMSHGYPHTTIARNSHHRNRKDLQQLSCTSYSIVFTLPLKNQLDQYKPTILSIGRELGMNEQAVNTVIKGRHGLGRIKQIKVQAGVDYTDGVLLELQLKQIRHMGKGAYQVITKAKRIHPNTLAAPLIGLIDVATGKGISGIEELFDSILQPTNGSLAFWTDANGNRIPMMGNIHTNLPLNGSDIFLTINSFIQNIAEEELMKAIPEANPDRAYAVMMKPQTGAIMALAQYPTFNPNKRNEVDDPAGFGFLPLTETFEPGSIMKGVSLSCGISEGVIDLNSIYFCENGRWGAERLRDTHEHQNLSISDIIKYSSNIGTAKATLDLGAYKLFRGLNGFGFGKKTHLGFYPAGQDPIFFKTEARGIFRPLERWDKLSISRFPIGQGISVTPFQMVQAYSAIANNGIMMQPYIIDRILSHDGTVTNSIPRVKGRPISSYAAKQMKEALKTVIMEDQKTDTGEIIKGGTGQKAAIKGYTVAGKTGTSQIWNSEMHHYEEHHVVASFIGFAPAEAPEFVLLVTFVNPKPKKHGGTIAAPVFSKIGARTLEYLQIPPENQENIPNRNQQETTKKR